MEQKPNEIQWKLYQGALIPDVAPHFCIHLTNSELHRLQKKYRPFFIRYYSNWDSDESQFWFVIKDKFEGFEELNSKTRNQVRKGLKNCDVRKIQLAEVLKSGYDVYVKAFKKYSTFLQPMTFNEFKESLSSKPNLDFFGVYNHEGRMIAYSQNELFPDFCNYSTTKFDPDFLKLRPSEALFFEMSRYYLEDLKLKYVCDGSRSISHETNIQSFLMDKMKFRKAFCQIHVHYRNDIGILIKLLYPFRSLIEKFNFNVAKKLGVLLKQEDIVRSYVK